MEKAIRHNFIRLHERLEFLNKELNALLNQLNSRPIGGPDSTLKKIQALQLKISKTTTEYLQAISNSIAFSVH